MSLGRCFKSLSTAATCWCRLPTFVGAFLPIRGKIRFDSIHDDESIFRFYSIRFDNFFYITYDYFLIALIILCVCDVLIRYSLAFICVLQSLHLSYYAPAQGALSDDAVWRLSDIWRLSVYLTSVAYIGNNSRTERPRKIKIIGTQVAHVTRD